jgi:ribonuclease P protein subunit POP4
MNARTLPRHELAGLPVEVTESPNADLVGLGGVVVDETTNTLLVGTGDGTKQVPKAAATFRFTLEDGQRVVVDGARLVARPARRTETTATSKWR